MTAKAKKYEENFQILEKISESLGRDDVSVDDMVTKTREALQAARNCIEILNHQKGEFKKLESEFAQLLSQSRAPEENG